MFSLCEGQTLTKRERIQIIRKSQMKNRQTNAKGIREFDNCSASACFLPQSDGIHKPNNQIYICMA